MTPCPHCDTLVAEPHPMYTRHDGAVWCLGRVAALVTEAVKRAYPDEPVKVRGLFAEPATHCRHGVPIEAPGCTACWLETRTRP